MSVQEQRRAVCRVLSGEVPAATGWLADSQTIVTVAHAIPRDGTISVHFPGTDPVEARVTGWFLDRELGTDCAFLAIAPSELDDRRPLRVHVQPSPPSKYRVIGFQEQNEQASEILSEFNGKHESHWLADGKNHGIMGFSGAPLLDAERGHVVAMQVRAAAHDHGAMRDAVLATPMNRVIPKHDALAARWDRPQRPEVAEDTRIGFEALMAALDESVQSTGTLPMVHKRTSRGTATFARRIALQKVAFAATRIWPGALNGNVWQISQFDKEACVPTSIRSEEREGHFGFEQFLVKTENGRAVRGGNELPGPNADGDGCSVAARCIHEDKILLQKLVDNTGFSKPELDMGITHVLGAPVCTYDPPHNKPALAALTVDLSLNSELSPESTGEIRLRAGRLVRILREINRLWGYDRLTGQAKGKRSRQQE